MQPRTHSSFAAPRTHSSFAAPRTYSSFAVFRIYSLFAASILNEKRADARFPLRMGAANARMLECSTNTNSQQNISNTTQRTAAQNVATTYNASYDKQTISINIKKRDTRIRKPSDAFSTYLARRPEISPIYR